jgi:hypothetical protein
MEKPAIISIIRTGGSAREGIKRLFQRENGCLVWLEMNKICPGSNT